MYSTFNYISIGAIAIGSMLSGQLTAAEADNAPLPDPFHGGVERSRTELIRSHLGQELDTYRVVAIGKGTGERHRALLRKTEGPLIILSPGQEWRVSTALGPQELRVLSIDRDGILLGLDPTTATFRLR
jgi:hypothetical protein